jgi:hypothetical protein
MLFQQLGTAYHPQTDFVVFTDLPKLSALDCVDTEPETILDRRMKKGNHAIAQVLIKWKNLPEESTTWEDWDVLKTSFPAKLT